MSCVARSSMLSGLMVLALVGCSSSSTGSSNDGVDGSTPGGPGGASCADVCAKLTSVCGPVPPDCVSGCETQATASQLSCAAAATGCEAVITCLETTGPTPTTDAGTKTDAGHVGADTGGTHPCDGTRYCKDAKTSAVCSGGETDLRPCGGQVCALGYCGACSKDGDCKGIAYSCKCADGAKVNGVADTGCTSMTGSQKFCAAPSGVSLCSAHGGLDFTYGYLDSGCFSTVDLN